MQLGIVVGCLWATKKNTSLTSQRFLVVQPVTPELADKGK